MTFSDGRAAETSLQVASDAALAEALPLLDEPGPWGLDTEFMRVDTYYPQLCLIQISTSSHVVCIDPLALSDLAPLAAGLADPARRKLMHAARQDLEALAVSGLAAVNGIADTQIAASLLGLPDQVGYAWLVEHYRGVVLDKSQTRTDWERRPLTEAQWHYAAQDVLHLLPLWEIMSAALAAEGKRGWFEEECARLGVDDTAPPWQRVKGLSQYEGPALAVAQALCVWRENEAKSSDRPRTWILRDEVLLALVRLGPAKVADLPGVPGLQPATVRRHGEALLEVIAAAATQAPVLDQVIVPRLTPAQSAALLEMQEVVKACAVAHNIVPTLLATRRELERLVCGLPAPRLGAGWRLEVLGTALPQLRGDAVPEAGPIS